MIKKLLVLACASMVSYNCFTQTFYKLEEQAILGNVSRNGQWAFGSQSEVGTYLYNITEKKLSYFEGTYADGVSDHGTLAGSMENNLFPAICKDGKWMHLPTPKDTMITECCARDISADETIICGHTDYKGPEAGRRPCIWTLQSDGSYLYKALPYPDKDLTDRTPQATDALLCSAKGDIVGGRLVDYSGGICLPIYWKKNASDEWEWKYLGKNIMVKEGAEFPSVPEYPDAPDPMKYYTKEDSTTYNNALAQYQETHIGDNPEWNKEKYITTNSNKYNEDAKAHNDLLEVISTKLNECYELLTEKYIDVYSLSMSSNGQYIASYCTQPDPNAEPDPWGGAELYSPMYLNVQTGEATILDFVADAISDGMTDNGDFFYATPNLEHARTAFVLPKGSKNPIEFSEWVKQQSKEKLDIKPELLFSFEYTDMVTWETKFVVDSLITGDAYPSADGKVILGNLLAPTGEGEINYIVNLNDTKSVADVSKDPANTLVYPNPVKDLLYLKGDIQRVSIIDLTGRTIYESSSVSESIDVSSFGKGSYLVKMLVDGKTIINKIVIANE